MYQTITQNTTFEIVEKKSKFIANLICIESKEDAETKIKELKKKYYDARHNCYAFRVLEDETIYEKSSDDGEPSGTAGSPMLNILQKNNLTNCLIIVTRYFGGILLGTGGLVRAYSSASIGAIENAEKIIIEIGTEFEAQIEYPNFQAIEYYFKQNEINITKIDYLDTIKCNIEMDNNAKTKFLRDVQEKKINILKIVEIGKKYIRKNII
jgi:uncharacterized YigZ family protein